MADRLFVGWSNLKMDADSYELAHGIKVHKTFAHLMAPYIMAFGHPKPGKAHPGPWKAARGGSGFDISAEMLIPGDTALGDPWEVLRTMMFLMRVGVDPAATASALSSDSFARLKDLPSDQGKVVPYEIRPRLFRLHVENASLNAETAEWVAGRIEVAHRLRTSNEEFQLAVAAIEAGQFEMNFALTLVSLWSALEALFSRERSEL